MKYGRSLLMGLLALLFLGGCGTTVQESLKVQPAVKNNIGADKTVVILPFADYSYSDNIETAYQRNLYITENLTDELGKRSFHLPVQEDVFLYLVDQKIINVLAYEKKKTASLERELDGEWSAAMKQHIQRYIDLNKKQSVEMPVLEAPGTHGLTQQEIVKIGRHFMADYIVRGRIIQFKERQDPSWAPWKKGVLSFVAGATNKIAFGHADSDKYDNWGNMISGGAVGLYLGDKAADWPYSGKPDQTILGISGGDMANTLIWGGAGVGLGNISHHTGKVPQAVVQLRIWIQDAYNGDVVWTNRVDVKVSPESVFADYQYDALFEGATEKAIATLINNFAASL